MIIVLQITDLLFKYASQEPMYIFKYLIKTTREGMSILLAESGGCDTIRTHKFSPKKNNPKRHMEPESLNQKLITKYTATKGSKESCSKNNKKINRLEVAGNSLIVAEEMRT